MKASRDSFRQMKIRDLERRAKEIYLDTMAKVADGLEKMAADIIRAVLERN